MNPTPRRSLLPSLAAVALFAATAASQCAPQPLPGLGTPGVGLFDTAPGVVHATTLWDPDGAGPAGPVLVLGGDFSTLGTTPAANIGTYDPSTGATAALGSGTNNTVRGLAVTAAGDLIAVGSFQQAGGVAASFAARWNGTAWSPLGAGLNGPGYSVLGLPGGDVVVGGQFTQAGGVATNLAARWNGSTWSAMGFPLAGGKVAALATLANGDVVAGNDFVYRWNGTSWLQLGTLSGVFSALQLLPNGDLAAAGLASGVLNSPGKIARWDGANWLPFGTDPNDDVRALAVLPNGDLVAGGEFTLINGVAANRIARFDGVQWQPLAGGATYDLTVGVLPGVFALRTLPGGDLAAGGAFRYAGGVPADSIARWNGTAWTPLAIGTNGTVLQIVELQNGDRLAVGDFTSIDGVAANRVARFDGVQWQPLGSGVDKLCLAATELPNGDLVVGGLFLNAGGQPASHIARWDGAAWHAMGVGIDGDVFALATMPNGDVVAGGGFNNAGGAPAGRIARWNGSAWSAMGTFGGAIAELLVARDGTLFAGGFFLSVDNAPAIHVAHFDGTTWSPLGGGTDAIVQAMVQLPGGDVVAAGAAPLLTNHLYRWDGSLWTSFAGPLPSNSRVNGLAALPGGDLIVGGLGLPGSTPTNSVNLARWNGVAWSEVAQTEAWVRDVAVLADGSIVIGGSFHLVDGAAVAYHARLVSACPAVSLPLGAGCSSSTAPLQLEVDALPWLGSTFATTATGFAPSSFAVWELGLSTLGTPMPLLHPAGGVGCTQWINSDLLSYLLLPSGGAVSAGVFVPADPAFVGLVFHHMVASVEVDASLQITRLAGTNAVTLTIGSY
ncbi:MAG: hypothetical protein AB7O97_14540 [Planctomycetota bacterium]